MAQYEKLHLRRLKALEQTNSADLEALLLLDFQSQESGWAEMGEILRAAEILAERSPQRNSAGADRAWETFLEKYLPFSDGSSLYESAEAPGASALAVQPVPTPSLSLRRRMRRLALWGNHPVRRRILQTAACLALCLLLTGGLLLAFDPGARAAFSGWVRELCGDHFEYHYEARGETAGPKADQTAIYRPTWVLDGTDHLVWVNGHNDLYWISGSPGGEELLKMAESVIMGF